MDVGYTAFGRIGKAGREGNCGLNGTKALTRRRVGMTLIELLVAMSLLGVAISIASMVLLSGHQQWVQRWQETKVMDSAWLGRMELRKRCRDSLSGIRLVGWNGKIDSCLYPKPANATTRELPEITIQKEERPFKAWVLFPL